MATNMPQGDWQKQGLRLPKDLHADIHAAAAASGRSYNSEVVHRLKTSVLTAAREIAPFGLRMTPSLRAAIEAASEASGRSMNAEVTHRLQQTFPLYGAAYPELSAYPTAALLAELGRRCP